MKKNKKNYIFQALAYVYLIIMSIIATFPLVWILISSVKGKGQLTGDPTKFWPKSFTLDYYKHVIYNLGFSKNILNSIVIALSTTFITLLVSCLAAYAVVRFFPKFGKKITKVLVTTYMFPPVLLAVPYSIVMAKLGLVNTRIGLMIVYLSFSIPYAVWLLVGFFQTVPISVEEAARIDGANRWQIFSKIVMPLVAPGVVATGIYTFINAWNEFLYSLILMNSTEKMTVSVALKSLDGAEILDWGDMMAASALVVIPSVIFFMLIQNKIAGGLSEGAVK